MAGQRAMKAKPRPRQNFPKSRSKQISKSRSKQKEVIPQNAIDAFSAKREYIGLKSDDSDSNDSDELDDEEILPLEVSESESEDDKSEDEDDVEESDGDDDHIEEAESMPKSERRQKKIQSEDAITTAWGKKRNIFYGSEAADFEIDSESENEAREEEEEALRLQRQMFSKMDENDFDADDLDLETELKSAPGAAAESEELESKVIRNLDALTTEEKLRHIAKDSPELLGLLQELTKAINEIKEKISKGADQQVDGAGPEGISLLTVQHHLLLHYCVSLVFYLLMKAEGRPVRGHPVIDRLITIRTMLERISPIRSKIAYMVDKIVRQQPTSSDPLRFKPSVDELGECGSDDDVESEDDRQDRSNNVYVPPKHRMVPYEEEDTKAKKREERKLKKLHASEFMQSLRDEFSSAPEQLQTHDSSDCESADERERRQFEEENFLRLSDAKKKKKSKSSIVEEFDDFENISGLLGTKGSDNDDDDELQALRKAKSRSKSSNDDQHLQAAIASSSVYDDIDDDDFDFYSAAQKKAEKAAKKKTEQKSAKSQQKVEYVDDIAEGRRGASKKIVQNRGIKRYRNKDDKNPRVKHRRRFEKALVKRKGLVKEFTQKHSTSYGGESTGIKPHLSRSVSYK